MNGILLSAAGLLIIGLSLSRTYWCELDALGTLGKVCCARGLFFLLYTLAGGITRSTSSWNYYVRAET